ncbi:hypothetical protein BD626DRAFT_520929, partial [Schizophyllum amplum]
RQVHEGRVGDRSSFRVLQVFNLLGCRALHLPWRLSRHCEQGSSACRAASAEGATPAHSLPKRPLRAVVDWQTRRDQPENSCSAFGLSLPCLLSSRSRPATGFPFGAGSRPPALSPSCEKSSEEHDEATDGEDAEPAVRAATPRSSGRAPLPTRIRTGTPAVRRQSPAGLAHWTYAFVPLCTRSTTHRPRPRRGILIASDTSHQSWLLPSNRVHEQQF